MKTTTDVFDKPHEQVDRWALGSAWEDPHETRDAFNKDQDRGETTNGFDAWEKKIHAESSPFDRHSWCDSLVSARVLSKSVNTDRTREVFRDDQIRRNTMKSTVIADLDKKASW